MFNNASPDRESYVSQTCLVKGLWFSCFLKTRNREKVISTADHFKGSHLVERQEISAKALILEGKKIDVVRRKIDVLSKEIL